MTGEALEAGVGARVLGLLGHVEPVVDVDVRREPVRLQRRDRLPRDVELDRLVQEELARPRVDHGRALVADDRLADPRPLEVRLDRAEHPARRDEDRDSGRLRPRDRGERPIAQHRTPVDQRAVEVAGERLHGLREAVDDAQRDGG